MGLLVLAMSWVLLLVGCADPDPDPMAVDGVLDLRDWDPGTDGSVALQGDWELWWSALHEPGALPLEADHLVAVPGSWNDLPGPSGPLGATGTGTYRLRILLPETPVDLSLRMASVATAHRLYLNGQPRIGGGVVSMEPDGVVADGTRWLHGVPGAAGELEVVVQVANADYRRGGLRRAPLLGRSDAMQVGFQRRLLVDIAVVVTMLAVGLYQLGLFSLRPGLRVHLPFGVMSVLIGLRATLSRDGQAADMLLPGMTWAVMIRLEYLLTWLAVGASLWWIAWMFPAERPRRLIGALLVGVAIGAGFTALAPVSVFTASTMPLELATVAAGVIVLVTATRATHARRPGASLLLVSLVFCLTGIVWDLQVSQNPDAVSTDIATLAFIGLMIAESVRVALDYARSFQTIENLTVELRAANADLESTNKAIIRFVPQEFLEVIGRNSIRDVSLGDHSYQEVAVLFLDIQGFTPLIESMLPEEGFGFINDFLGELVPEIRKHEGFVNHFLGDAILAIFHGSADAAVQGAVALLVALERLNATREAPISVGLGLHCGPLMMGIIGSHDRLDPNVVGDTVNTAARLEGMTRLYGTPLLLSGETVSRLEHPEVLTLRELDCVVAKGKTEPVTVFEVLSVLPTEKAGRIAATRARFAEGRALYQAGRFLAAAAVFEGCVVAVPEDAAAALYVVRCGELAAEAPADWRGVTVLTRK
ncbi:MAG: adenylate cyclase [Myxococcota bacterium]|jgi:adenylate cyclase